MFVPFEQLSSSSRIWIYQAERKFSDSEIAIIQADLKLFTQGWETHGHPMEASFQIAHNQFVIVAANESAQPASGCSIDDSVRALTQLANKLKVDFFNRQMVVFKMGDISKTLSLSELKSAARVGLWNEKTLTFNNLINKKSQLENEWVIPAGQTWLKRYLVAETTA